MFRFFFFLKGSNNVWCQVRELGIVYNGFMIQSSLCSKWMKHYHHWWWERM